MEQEAYIAGAILLFGILLFLFLSTRKKYRDPSSAQRYEKVTEKLTVREPEPEPEEDDRDEGFGFHFSIGNLIASTIAVLIGISLLGPITEQVEITSVSVNSVNVSSSMMVTIFQMVPAFFALGILGVVIAVIWSSLQREKP